MMTAAKIVETVPWIDAKYYASTQTMDEARHTEVFAKYLRTKLGDAYPMSPFLKEQIWSLLEDSRWDIAYLGMQIVIESLALAAFGDMLRRTKEPLLTKLLRYVMSDEARHVAFGVLTLSEFYRDLSEAELKERQEFLRRRHAELAVPGHHARGVGAHGDDGRGGLPLHHARRRRRQSSTRCGASPAASSPSWCPTCASSACSTPTTATCARSGARPACSSSSSPTTPARTTSPTTPWPRTGRRRRGGADGAAQADPASAGERGASAIERVRAICLALPEAEERPFGGHTAPAFRVRDKLFVMTSEDGTSMTLKAPEGRNRSWWPRSRRASSSRSTSGPRAGSGCGWISGPRPTGTRWPR